MAEFDEKSLVPQYTWDIVDNLGPNTTFQSQFSNKSEKETKKTREKPLSTLRPLERIVIALGRAKMRFQ